MNTTDMKKTFAILLTAAALFCACDQDFVISPAISFFSDKPAVQGDSAIFRVASAYLPEDTQVRIPVTFGGSAVQGVDYKASSDHFMLGGEEPLDSIIIWTLNTGSGKDLSLSLVLPEGYEPGKYMTSQYTLQEQHQ